MMRNSGFTVSGSLKVYVNQTSEKVSPEKYVINGLPSLHQWPAGRCATGTDTSLGPSEMALSRSTIFVRLCVRRADEPSRLSSR